MNNHFMKRGRNQRRRQGGGPNPNRALDSNGPDVRIRGTAQQIYDKYLALARDAQSSGDRVKAENYLQHAEHYFRVLRSVQGAPPVSQFDQNNQDGDFDGIDQPVAGDPRGDRPQHQSYGGEDQSEMDPSQDEQPDVPAYGDDRSAEPRPDHRPQNNQGQSGGQSVGQNGGDHEGRRRRRRPRRHREDGGAPADGAPADQDVEPVGA
ncbi:MAG TPA: DUF4167 domain-containing protein [Parvularcula sp.]|nr:DUF4167 domain-containing protein [Parvularcula sp.]HBS33408.1 DUF4167 domain-containing protein [Parvularcula sp.]